MGVVRVLPRGRAASGFIVPLLGEVLALGTLDDAAGLRMLDDAAGLGGVGMCGGFSGVEV